MQKVLHLGGIAHIGRRRRNAVLQAGMTVHANVRLHPGGPLVAVLGLEHLGVTLAFLGSLSNSVRPLSCRRNRYGLLRRSC
jgi:hypothetical protein